MNPAMDRFSVKPKKDFASLYATELDIAFAPAVVLLWETFIELYGRSEAPIA